MATQKTRTSIWASQSLTASSADTTSSAVNLTDGYDVALNIRFTNLGTGPTIPAQVQIQTSFDNSVWFPYGGVLVGNTTASSTTAAWGCIPIPNAVMYLRLVAGSNTGQAVEITADLAEITDIAV